MGGPVPDNLYDCDYDDEGLDHSVRRAEFLPEIKEFKKNIGYTQKKTLRKQSENICR